MDILLKCINELETLYLFLIDAFNKAKGEYTIDKNGNKAFGYEETVIRCMPSNCSTKKENKLYRKGDMVSANGHIFICKVQNIGQDVFDDFYFRQFDKRLISGLGHDIKAWGSTVENTVFSGFNVESAEKVNATTNRIRFDNNLSGSRLEIFVEPTMSGSGDDAKYVLSNLDPDSSYFDGISNINKEEPYQFNFVVIDV